MKVVMVMFDSLNRHMLPPYGAQWVHAPNFTRLARHAVTFDRCYAGSLPCVPARRELHTGRYNFLHRSWGPLEPFDDSMPEILKASGIHSHLVTDHQHYFEDGGGTYHTRFSTWEFFRGQEGDPWKGRVADPEIPDSARHGGSAGMWRQDWVNREYMRAEAEHPQTRTFDAGLEFLYANHEQDNWFLQVETFDPHEPFFTYKHYKDLYPHDYDGPHFDWPNYGDVTHSGDQVAHARFEYAALLSMCDHSLGRLLDTLDTLAMWDDTMLIVCTDHGFLLGESGWWGKNVTPWCDELVHLPLFIWDPRHRAAGERRESLVQTIDLAPTILDAFGLPPTPDMQGVPLGDTVGADRPVREAGLFGVFGDHVNITDGRYVYMRAGIPGNVPLAEYTLMPTHMRQRFGPGELTDTTLAAPFSFTKQVPTVRIPKQDPGNRAARYGTLLFDTATDPYQQRPITDPQVERYMLDLLVRQLAAGDAPAEQYERLGVSPDDPGEASQLRAHEGMELADRRRAEAGPAQKVAALLARIGPAAQPNHRLLLSPIRRLMADPAAGPVLRAHLPGLLDSEVLTIDAGTRLVEFAAGHDDAVSPEQLADLVADLARVS